MTRFHRTRKARADLIDIWRFVAADNPDAADALLDRLDEACRKLAEYPERGPARDDIRPGLRYLVVDAYLVLYRVLGDGVEIVRVVHGKRDLFNLD